MQNYNILITNDDGIESPGLQAAVAAVLDLGTVTICAPSSQQTASGRGMTGDLHAHLLPVAYSVDGQRVKAYHCDCSPALIVRHSLQTLFEAKKPDLLISGINYGENLGCNITSSGTIGAALEASSFGIPAIAISKQTDIESHRAYTYQDWSASQYYLQRFSRYLLTETMAPDIDVLKIDIPFDATAETGWKITKLAKCGYYFKEIGKPHAQSKINEGRTIIKIDPETIGPDTDIHALAIEKVVSVTPLSLDLTSRVVLSDLQDLFNNSISDQAIKPGSAKTHNWSNR